MIAAVRGVLEGKSLDSLYVTIGGVTVKVQVPLSLVARLNTGDAVHLHTYLHVREDMLALYGFTSAEDRDMFEQLLAVGGVGPRIGLGLLSGMSAQQLYEAVLTEDIARLTAAPGVGRKLATRLVLELRPRFEKMVMTGTSVPVAGGGNTRAQVIEALTGLGYTPAQAAQAVRSLPEQGGLEDLIMQALRNLASD